MRGYLRRRRAQREALARLEAIDRLFERVHEAEPCPDPDCLTFRAEIHQLSKRAVAPSVEG